MSVHVTHSSPEGRERGYTTPPKYLTHSNRFLRRQFHVLVERVANLPPSCTACMEESRKMEGEP